MAFDDIYTIYHGHWIYEFLSQCCWVKPNHTFLQTKLFDTVVGFCFS